MKRYGWLIVLGTSLVFLSAGLYFIHYLIFRDAHHIYLYLVGDLAFLPIEVLLVTVIVDSMLGMREKHATMEKMNMVIGAFFSEMGLGLLEQFIAFGICPADLAEKLKFSGRWTDADFKRVSGEARGFDYRLDRGKIDFQELRTFLLEKREFFLRLLENRLDFRLMPVAQDGQCLELGVYDAFDCDLLGFCELKLTGQMPHHHLALSGRPVLHGPG